MEKKSIQMTWRAINEQWRSQCKIEKRNFKHFGPVEFPPPNDISINMMPFTFGKNETIPDEYKAYVPLIDACLIPANEVGKTYYLTIQENVVEVGHYQRRPGLHTDRHATFNWGNGRKGDGADRTRFRGPIAFHPWGGFGGIYMASNVSGTCAVWDTYIEEPGLLGDCEEKREELGEPHLLEANQLYWITDGTPHESLPMPATGCRQFFRLVSSEVDLWYEQHSTRNPLGVEPIGRIITENKFDEISLK